MRCLNRFKVLGVAPLVTLLAGIFFINLIIVYLMAVINKDVDPFLPYISEAADRRPQSCVFAMGVNISCAILLFIVYARYKQFRGIAVVRQNYTIYYTNKRARWFGYLAVLGMFVVANVQDTAIISVHMTAAATTFGFFNVYMVFQCYLTYLTTPSCTTRTVLFYRVTFTVLSSISFVLAITFGIVAAHIFHQTYPDLPTPRPWNRRIWQPGYGYHQASAFFEWSCAICQIFFIQSFGPEFEDIHLRYYLRSTYIVHRQEEHDEWDRRARLYGL